jgi:hypothetical protein
MLLVLISVKRLSKPQGLMRPEGLGKLIKIIHFIGLITGNILKELPIIRIKYLTQLFSAVLVKDYFPARWELAEVILILKPGRSPNELS